MKRVAVFNRFFSTQAGGAESYSVALSRALAAKKDSKGAPKYEVHVFAQNMAVDAPELHLHKVPGYLKHPRWLNQMWFALYTWWQTRRDYVVISHENTWHGQIQVVHVRPIRYNLFYPNNSALAGWRLGLRWLKIMTSPRLLSYLWLEGARMQAPHVVPVSELSNMQIERAYPELLSRNLDIITPGVLAADTSLTQQQARALLKLEDMNSRLRGNDEEGGGNVVNEGKDGATTLLLFVANDYARKGLDALLQSLSHLPMDVQLVVVGKTDQKNSYQAKAQGLGVSDRVHFVGSLADMRLAYRAADVMVHPTLEDAFPMVVMEAMSYGLPVIVSGLPYCGSSAHFTDGGDVLLLSDPKDQTHITRAIHRVIGDKALATSLGAHAQAFVKNYDWNAISMKFEALIDQNVKLA